MEKKKSKVYVAPSERSLEVCLQRCLDEQFSSHSAADFRLERTSNRSTILCVSADTRAAAVDA